MLLGLLAAEGIEDPLGVLIAAIPFNFYAWLALATVFLIAISGRDYGPMRAAEEAARAGLGKVGATEELDDDVPEKGKKARNLLVPVLVLVAIVPFALRATGDGDWTRSSS